MCALDPPPRCYYHACIWGKGWCALSSLFAIIAYHGHSPLGRMFSGREVQLNSDIDSGECSSPTEQPTRVGPPSSPMPSTNIRVLFRRHRFLCQDAMAVSAIVRFLDNLECNTCNCAIALRSTCSKYEVRSLFLSSLYSEVDTSCRVSCEYYR